MGGKQTLEAGGVCAPVKPGAHLCLLYETEEQYRSFVFPFLRQGIELNEKVVYSSDVHTFEDIADMLKSVFPGESRELLQTQFHVLSSRDTYLKYRYFDPDAMIESLREEAELALSEGYSGLRAAGEMSWALSGAAGAERLIEYEEKLDAFLPGTRCVSLCIYDMKRFSPETLVEVLRTHTAASAGGPLRKNVFHSPPPVKKNPAERLRRMISYFESGEIPETEDVFHDFVVNVPGVIYRCACDEDWTMEFISNEVQNITGHPPEEFIGNSMRTYASIIHPDDRKKVQDTIRERVGKKLPYNISYRIITSSDSVKWVEENGRGVFRESGELLYLDGVIIDITAAKTAEEGKKDLLEKIGFVLNSAKTNIDIIDSDYNLLYVDPAWEKTYGGYGGKKCYEYFFKIQSPCRDCKISEAIRTGEPQVAMRTLSGENSRLVQVSTLPFKNDKGEWLVAEINADITDIKNTADKIDYFSVHDSLTGVYTRAFVEAELKRIDCDDNLPLGVMFCRVDNLSSKNVLEDGKEFLLRTAELLKNSLRDEDVTGMWEKDRFIVIMPYTSGRRSQSLARSLVKTAGRIKAGGETLSISTGLALKGSTEEDIKEIIKQAEENLRAA